MTAYRNVTIDNDIIEGERDMLRSLNPDNPWVRFSANRRLLHIREAIDSYDGALMVTWKLQDGYGEPGYTPPQGWDWSGIRDSSEGALTAMYEVARRYLSDDDFAAILGVS